MTEGAVAGSLTVAAGVTEEATLTYQWYTATAANNTGGTKIDGATAASYILPTDLKAGTYYYFCEVGAEGAKPVRTVVVTVTVNAKPVPVITITAQPAAPTDLTEGSIPADTRLTVEATATEGATLSYQWHTYDPDTDELFEVIEGATAASYTLPTTLTEGTYYYVCEITAEGATAVQTDPVPVTVAVRLPDPTYNIEASSTAPLVFGSLETPYTQPAAQTVTITNTGTGAVTLTQPTAENYTTGTLSATELAATATATFTVRPKADLAAGTYNEAITVNGSGGAKATVDARFTVTTPATPAFVPVTNITGVPTEATAGTPLTLTGTVEPSTATNKTIVWTVKSAGDTDAAVSGGTFIATGAGTATVTATIINGATESTPYTKDFTITVSAPASTFVPVTNMSGVPTEATAGTPLTLTGTVEPSTATNKTIVWTVKSAGDTGATISGATFTAIAAGTAIVTATIANGTAEGTPYTKDFTVTVTATTPAFVPVTNITGVPTAATAETSLTLTGTIEPSTATNKTIVWSVKSAGDTGATISDGTFTSSAEGTAIVTATIVNGTAEGTPYTKDFTVTVTAPVAGITWTYANGTLIITGSGAMPDYANASSVPWSSHRLDIKTVFISPGITSIGQAAFVGCEALTNASIPNSVTSIGYGAFANCRALESITIPAGVTTIGEAAFTNCRALKSVTCLAATPPPFNRYNFDYPGVDVLRVPAASVAEYKASSRWREAFTYIVEAIGDFTIDALPATLSFSSLEVGYAVPSAAQTVTVINTGTGAVTLTQPASTNYVVGTLSRAALAAGETATFTVRPKAGLAVGTYNEAIAVGGSNSATASVAVRFTVMPPFASGTTGTLAWRLSADGTLTITGIGVMPDYDNTGSVPWHSHRADIETVVIGLGVTSIEFGAFINCTALTEITIPESVTTIGMAAFDNCTALKEITIPAGVTTIRNWAFFHCNALASVTCLATAPPTFGDGNFITNTADVLRVPAAAVTAYKKNAAWGSAFSSIVAIP
jgi:hypothetical protein